MILQTDPDWKHLPMAENGCAALSALWYVSRRGILPSSVHIIEEDILHMIFAGMHSDDVSPISEDCYVNSYDAIAKWYNIRVMKPARHETARYICEPYEEEILEWRLHGKRHFTAGNGSGITTYDPMGYWRGFPSAKLVSKRIICWSKTPHQRKGVY